MVPVNAMARFINPDADPKREQEFRQRATWRGVVRFEDAITNDGGLMRLARPDRVDRSGVGPSFRDLPPMPVEY